MHKLKTSTLTSLRARDRRKENLRARQKIPYKQTLSPDYLIDSRSNFTVLLLLSKYTNTVKWIQLTIELLNTAKGKTL